MAQGENKEINQLEQATEIQDADLFVLEQGGDAKKLLGSTLKSYAEEAGINAIREIYPRTPASNDPANSVFDVEIPDAGEAPMHSTVIKGKTVAQNQLSRPIASATTVNGITVTPNADGSVTLNGTATAAGQIYSFQNINGVKDHAYYIKMVASASVTGLSVYTGIGGSIAITEGIRTSGSTGGQTVTLRGDNGAVYNNVKVFVMTTDLTARGFTSAETTDVTTLKYAWLKKYGTPIPQYIPYDTGSLANVNGVYQLHGKNLYDINSAVRGGIDANTGAELAANSRVRSDYMPVKPSTVYRYNTNNSLYLVYIVYHYDANKNFIRSATQNSANSTTTTPDNAAYTRIVLRKSDNNDFTKDAVQNMYFAEGSNDAPFEPYYNGGEIDLSSAPLNGLDTTQDEEDFATGERATRFAQYTFDGTENWEYVSSWTHHGFRLAGAYFTAIIPNGKNGGALFMLGAPYTNIGSVSSWSTIAANDKQVGTANSIGGITISDDAYSDAATFAAAMVGKVLVYELATPVTTTETPQPLETQYGYNVLEPVSGGVQSAGVDTVYYENIAGYIDKRLNGG